MKVAVVTPYYEVADEWLLQCHRSVKAQTHECIHILVADGRVQAVVDDMDVQHVVLPVNSNDYGDTPRGIGSVLAISQGFDAIAYLDADNWYYPDHIANMVQRYQQTGAAVISCARNLHRLDGSLMGACYEVDGEKFVDTSCYFLTREAFGLASVWWMMDADHHAIDDRVFWAHIKQKNLSRSHLSTPGVAYRTAFAGHYKHFGEAPPEGAKSGEDILKVLLKVREQQARRRDGA